MGPIQQKPRGTSRTRRVPSPSTNGTRRAAQVAARCEVHLGDNRETSQARAPRPRPKPRPEPRVDFSLQETRLSKGLVSESLDSWSPVRDGVTSVTESRP